MIPPRSHLLPLHTFCVREAWVRVIFISDLYICANIETSEALFLLSSSCRLTKLSLSCSNPFVYRNYAQKAFGIHGSYARCGGPFGCRFEIVVMSLDLELFVSHLVLSTRLAYWLLLSLLAYSDLCFSSYGFSDCNVSKSLCFSIVN